VRTFLETDAAAKVPLLPSWCSVGSQVSSQVERVVFVVFSDKDKSVYECAYRRFLVLKADHDSIRELIPEYFPDAVEEGSPAEAETKGEA
jgi:hypothetical protein